MKFQVFFIFLLGILVLGAGAFWYFHSHAAVPSADACRGVQIAAFGDSLVEGYGATTQGGFVTMLSRTLGTPVANYGVSGNTTADALARVGDVTQETSAPQVVLVLLGGNDALQHVPQTTTQANLEAVLSDLQAAHAHVVLLGVLGGVPFDPYAAMFSTLAAEFKVRYVPNVLAGLIGNTQYMSDEVHPNDAGYEKIATRIAPVVLQACQAVRVAVP